MDELISMRNKYVNVFSLPEKGQLRVLAEMKDDVHNLTIDMVVNQLSLRIVGISCDMQSIPDKICRMADTCLDNLVGKRVIPGLIKKFCGPASNGCTHLTNLFHDACYNLTLAQGRILRQELTKLMPNISDAQMVKIFFMLRPDLHESCVRYADNSPLVKKAHRIQVPDKVLEFVARVSG